MDEHIVLAVEYRLIELTGGDMGDNMDHHIKAYPYLPALMESLKGYEADRSLYPTLERYYPRLIAVFKKGSKR